MKAKVGGAQERAARKAVTRIEKQLARIAARELTLTDEMAEAAADAKKLKALSAEMHALTAEKGDLEVEWMEAVELLD